MTGWPALPLEPWRETYATLHRWSQVVGKVRMVKSPPVNHWWHVPLYLTSRGLTTSPIPEGPRTFQIDFDFLDHDLRISTSDGDGRTIGLEPMSVREFYGRTMAAISELGIDVEIWPVPVEIADPIPFHEDERHAAYDPDAVGRFWGALAQTDRSIKAVRDDFLGKASPVHFFWGSFDLAYTRFSGREAPPHPGIAGVADAVTREAYSHECWSAGWWPGEGLGEAAFYAYAYPAPEGFAEAPVSPAEARWSEELAEFVLPYEVVRAASDPDRAVGEFLRSTYAAAAGCGAWDRERLER